MTDASPAPEGTPPGPAATASAAAPEASAAAPMKAGRIALGAALLLALGAGGVAMYRSQQEPTPAAGQLAAAGEVQPTVDEVIARLEARLKENPQDAEGWRMLGWSYFQTERFAEAATAMKRATTLDPKNAEYFSMLGEALVMASKDGGGLPPDAKAAFDTALVLDPKDARARYFRAVALDLDGKHTEALDGWFALLDDTPADAPYADDVRDVIRNVGKERKIDVEKRLAATSPLPPAKGFTTDGADVAAAGIPGPTRSRCRPPPRCPRGQQDAMVRGMVDGLEAKLKANPDNAPMAGSC